jgi:hypothetical protein
MASGVMEGGGTGPAFDSNGGFNNGIDVYYGGNLLALAVDSTADQTLDIRVNSTSAASPSDLVCTRRYGVVELL